MEPDYDREPLPLGGHPELQKSHVLGGPEHFPGLRFAAELRVSLLVGEGVVMGTGEELAVQLPTVDDLWTIGKNIQGVSKIIIQFQKDSYNFKK